MQHSTFKENWYCVPLFKKAGKNREQTDFTMPLFA